MSRKPVHTLAAGLVLTALFASAAPAAAQEAIPDFSSEGIAWRQNNPHGDNTGFAPIPGDTGPGPVDHHADFPYAQNVVNRVGDFTNPNLTEWAAAELERRARPVMEGGIPFIPNSRCWPGGVPGLHFFPASVFYLQTEDQVWILKNRGEVRRVYLDVPHSDDPGFTWYGESIGHYEGGNTLVVDTVGLDDKGPIDRYNIPHTRALHVVERHIINADLTELRVEMTISDPGAFREPWRGMMVYGRATGRSSEEPAEWEEYVCNENSTEYFIPEDQLVPVPSATRRDF
jgi:hypothetical protein